MASQRRTAQDTTQARRETKQLRAQQGQKPKGSAPPRKVIPIADELTQKHTLYIGHLLREPLDAPTRRVTFRGQAIPNYRAKARVGGVRVSWTITGMQQYWRLALPTHLRLTGDTAYEDNQFDHQRERHRALIHHMAGCRFGKYV